ncbi:hypothetical protein LCGC14_1058400 [marine sediment metagenome]|uniref:Uncharacterized protein n=1 Tax=marine sediment metagenome TaxID=412755 RepID=A0A0F9MM09_9ZZZZ
MDVEETKQLATDINSAMQIHANERYKEGMREGLRMYAWWKDGVQYVGTCGKTLKEALAEIE